MANYVYILTNKTVDTFYVGVTNDTARRVWEHKQGITKGFPWKHGLNRLVCYQPIDDINEAIKHEKRIKKWPRKWKIKIIEEMNPHWDNLYETLSH